MGHGKPQFSCMAFFICVQWVMVSDVQSGCLAPRLAQYGHPLPRPSTPHLPVRLNPPLPYNIHPNPMHGAGAYCRKEQVVLDYGRGARQIFHQENSIVRRGRISSLPVSCIIRSLDRSSPLVLSTACSELRIYALYLPCLLW